MKLISILSIIFCAYAFISKGVNWFYLNEALQNTKGLSEVELALIATDSFQTNLMLIWFAFFALLLVGWIIAFIKKYEKLKIYLVSLTLLGALFMSVTDNIKSEVVAAAKRQNRKRPAFIEDTLPAAVTVVVQDDGKILVVGSSRAVGGGYIFALARYDANGNLDSGFSELICHSNRQHQLSIAENSWTSSKGFL